MTPVPISYLNGHFLPASEAALPLSDAGFVWGATVTDRLRTFRQKLFRLDDHLKRFRSSCELAFIPQPRTDAELAAIASELIEANAKLLPSDTELSLVVFATPGSVDGPPTLGMEATPLQVAHHRHVFETGAILEPIPGAIPATIIDPRIKHRSRLPWWIAKAKCLPGSEPLFTTVAPDQFVRETTAANFLAVIDGTLVSPPRATILNGISLLVVEELARSLGMAFHERELPLAEVLDRADECFLTNTSYCLAPVSRIADRLKPIDGPLFTRLIQAWSDLTNVDIRQQFLTNR